MRRSMTTNTLSRTPSRRRFLLVMAAVLMVSLSCNFPLLSGLMGGASSLEDVLQSSGLGSPEQVAISEESVIIEYAVFPSDSPELVINGWLNTLLAAFEAEPDVAIYKLITSLNDEPYMEITAYKSDLEGFSAEELTVEEFLERLEITDLRPADNVAYGLLSPLGLQLYKVDLNGSVLVVSYWPGPMADEAEVMAEWWGIFQSLTGLAEDVAAIEIENLYVDGSVITVRLASSDLLAYVNAEMSDLEYLAALTIESELVDLNEDPEGE